MSKLKKLLGLTLSVLLILSAAPVTLTASAASYTPEDGYFTYADSNGNEKVTSCTYSLGVD
ncbi:MAG: hypothetical protein LUH40_06185 [Clostridiales bacterium]|nr:hypothetical protein [Clostridiales bacterium]